MPNNKILKRGLVVGIIVLFIGIGIQPAFANEVSITTEINSEDDCNCKPVNNLHLVRLEKFSNKLDRLLVRLEIYTGILYILYRHKPDVSEEFKELSNRIITLRESNDALKSVFEFGLHDVICDALWDLDNQTLDYSDYLYNLMEEYPALIPIIYPIFTAVILVNTIIFAWYIALGCKPA